MHSNYKGVLDEFIATEKQASEEMNIDGVRVVEMAEFSAIFT